MVSSISQDRERYVVIINDFKILNDNNVILSIVCYCGREKIMKCFINNEMFDLEVRYIVFIQIIQISINYMVLFINRRRNVQNFKDVYIDLLNKLIKCLEEENLNCLMSNSNNFGINKIFRK